MKKCLIIIGAFLLALGPVRAQEGPWSLRQCIRHALENNITVRTQGIEVDQREIALETARSARLPSLGASASENFSFGRGLTEDNTYANTNTGSTSFSLGSEVPVFQGFQIRNTIRQNQLNLEAATAALEKARDDIRVAVAGAYVQILYTGEIAQVAASQVTIDSLQVVRLEEMLRQGKASVAEVAQQRAALSQSRLALTQAQANQALAVLELTQLLELPSPEGFAVCRPDTSAFALSLLPSPEDVFAEAVGFRPAILSALKRVDAAQAGIDLAKGAFLPSLSLSGGIGTNYYNTSGRINSSFLSQMKNNFSQYLGLSLSVPIFTRYNTRNNVRTAQLALKAEELQLENARKSLYKEIQQAYCNASSAQSKLLSCTQAVESARTAFELVSAKYENGKAGITEFNESRNGYIKACSDLAQARYENLYMCKLLEFYRGRELDF